VANGMNAYKDEKTPVAKVEAAYSSNSWESFKFCFLMRKMKCPMIFTPLGTEIGLIISK
jgi:hypothetical protein